MMAWHAVEVAKETAFHAHEAAKTVTFLDDEWFDDDQQSSSSSSSSSTHDPDHDDHHDEAYYQLQARCIAAGISVQKLVLRKTTRVYVRCVGSPRGLPRGKTGGTAR